MNQKQDLQVAGALTVKQEAAATPPATEAEKKAKQDEKRMDRLDEAAKSLLTGITLAVAVLGAVGLNSDRLPILFNSPDWWLVAVAILTAAASVILAVAALSTNDGGKEGWWVALGSLALVGSIGFIVLAAATGYTTNGRPTITSLSAKPTSEAKAEVSFAVRADGVDRDSHLTVFAVQLGQPGLASKVAYSAIVRPDDKGVVSQSITFALDMPVAPTTVSVQVYRSQDTGKTTSQVENLSDTARSCSAQATQENAPACATIVIPAGPKSTPSASP